MAAIAHLRAWRSLRQLSRRRFAFVPMRAKRISRVRGHLYWGYLDYDGALAELEIARQTLPNDARLFELKGYIERRRPGGNRKRRYAKLRARN